LAYAHGTLSALLAATARGAFDTSFLRTLARSALNWDFQRRTEGSVQRLALQELLDEPIEVALALGPHVWGQTPVIDLVALNALVRLHDPGSIFEFGTYTGHGTINLCLNAPAAQTYTLDLPPETRRSIDGLHWEQQIDDQTIGSSIRGAPSLRVTQLYQDSRELDTAPYARGMDFVFIDGGHEFEFVESDSRKAFEMVSPHGVIAWHDFSRACPGVETYITRLAKDHDLYVIDGTQIVFCYGPAGPPTNARVVVTSRRRQAPHRP
jgi:predicted O-methyltransferase YrrM